MYSPLTTSFLLSQSGERRGVALARGSREGAGVAAAAVPCASPAEIYLLLVARSPGTLIADDLIQKHRAAMICHTDETIIVFQ
ncbi:unnamed protein product [Colias eurytheme]|nr:unnamed protein product [Colias eurytheme]